MSGTEVLLQQVVDGRIVDPTVRLDEVSATDLVTGLRDAAVAAALHGKDSDDAVPVAVWWLVVEALRRSLVVSGAGVARDRTIGAPVVAAREPPRSSSPAEEGHGQGRSSACDRDRHIGWGDVHAHTARQRLRAGRRRRIPRRLASWLICDLAPRSTPRS